MIVGNARPRLTIDVGPLMEDFWTGIPVFTGRLVRALAAGGKVDLDFSFNLAKVPADRVMAALELGSGSFLREDFERRSAVDYELADVTTPILYPSTKGSVNGLFAREASTIHDVSTLLMPEFHEEANIAYHLDHIDQELATNDVTFCISRSTQAALHSAFPTTTTRTRLLYQYVDWPKSFALLDRNLPPLDLGRYAVVLGTLEPRKNLQLLIRALDCPQIARSNLKLVIIGRRGWLVDQVLRDLSTEAQQRLIFSGFVTEFVKYRLIKACEFLIFPSVYEGFGIPAIEAMTLGKPVLAARSSSFPEVIGNAGIFFDPYSKEDFAAAFEEIAHPARINELAPKAISQSKEFGPERMAKPVEEWILAG